VTISAQMIKELRDLTGAGVLDTKKALEATGGDMERAADLLREKGLARAAKRADREAKEGRIEARSQGGRTGLLVEVNCETDFVGRNEGFVALSDLIATHLFHHAYQGQPLDEVLAKPAAGAGGRTPADQLQDMVSSTGEKMQVRRYVRYDLDERLGVIEVYLHPGNRVAVMLELTSVTLAATESAPFALLAHDLALHIAAMSPRFRSRQDIPADHLEAETARFRQGATAEGKPEKVVERIVEGRLRKYFEETVLFEQPFVKDEEVTAGQLLQQQAAALGEAITLARFVRYELGEDLD